MIRRALLGCLVAVGLLVPTAGQAQAACAWQRTELPVPEYHVGTEVWGVGGEYVVGTTQHQGIKGIRWHNGQGTLLGVPSIDPNSTAEPRDVNSSGTVAGTMRTKRPDESIIYDAYIMRLDGSYQLLGPSTQDRTVAVGINDRGDVVGYSVVNGDTKTVVWWAADYSKYQVIGSGVPEGISDAGKVVTGEGLMISKLSSGLFLGRRVQRPAGADYIVVGAFENGTPVGWSWSSAGHQVIVWNANGSIRSTTPGMGYTANNIGTVLGERNGEPALWRNGRVDTLPSPTPRMIPGRVFVDNRDIISGTYVGPGNQAGAAQWRCS